MSCRGSYCALHKTKRTMIARRRPGREEVPLSGAQSHPPQCDIDDTMPILQVEADMQLAYFTNSNQSVLDELNVDLRQYKHPKFLERAITSRRNAVKLKLEEAKKMAAKRNSLTGQVRGLCTRLSDLRPARDSTAGFDQIAPRLSKTRLSIWRKFMTTCQTSRTKAPMRWTSWKTRQGTCFSSLGGGGAAKGG